VGLGKQEIRPVSLSFSFGARKKVIKTHIIINMADEAKLEIVAT